MFVEKLSGFPYAIANGLRLVETWHQDRQLDLRLNRRIHLRAATLERLRYLS